MTFYSLSRGMESKHDHKNIKTGFKITGICPFNKDAIQLLEEKQLENLTITHLLYGQDSNTSHCIVAVSRDLPRKLLCYLEIHTKLWSFDSPANDSGEALSDSPATGLLYHSSGFTELLGLPEASSRLNIPRPLVVLLATVNRLKLIQRKNSHKMRKKKKQDWEKWRRKKRRTKICWRN